MKLFVISAGYPGSGWSLGLRGIASEHVPSELPPELERWRQQSANERMAQPPSQQLIERVNAWFSGLSSAQTQVSIDERDLGLLEHWAEHFPDVRFLLFYTDPVTALSHALRQGMEPSAFVDGWREAAAKIARFQRRYRRRSLLLNAENAGRDPDAMIAAASQTGLQLSVAGATQNAPDSLTLERLLAGRWLAGKPELDMVVAELDALAYPLGEHTSTSEPETWQLIERYQSDQTRYLELTADRDEQAKAADGKAGEIKSLQLRLSELENTKKETAEENELLLLQLHQVQEELEQHFVKNQELSTTLEEQTKAADAKAAELRKVADGKAGEIKSLQLRLSELENTKKETAEENELLLLQLHQVQEELEQHFLKNQELLQNQASAEAPPTDHNTTTPDSEPRPAKKTRPARVKPSKRPPALSSRSLFGKKRKIRRRLERDVAVIRESGLFEEAWYLQRYPDVAAAGFDAIEHYVCQGVKEERNPASWFNTRSYLETNPDVANAGINPFIHYYKFGKDEKRSLGPNA